MTKLTPSVAEPSQQALLRHFVEEMSGELQLEPLLSRIVEYACRLIGADDGTIGLYDMSRQAIRTAAVYNMPERELGAEMPAGVGLAGKVLASGVPFIGRYGDIASMTLPELADNQVIGMPIRWKGEITGFMGIGLEPPRQWPGGAQETLAIFARHAGIAIENARRYERARRRTARFELVAKVAKIINVGHDLKSMLQQTADAVHDVLEFANVDIPLLDPANHDVLVVEVRGGGYKSQLSGVDRIPISRGVMGAAVRTRKTQRVDNAVSDGRYIAPPTTSGARAEIAAPIFAAGDVVGVINVEGDQPYDSLDQNTVEVIADHLGIAIENARLHEQSREAAVWQERGRLRRELHDSVTQILSSISLLSQSLPSAWRTSAEEGERRAARLTELAKTAFAEMRALLQELQPPQESQADPHISKTSRSLLGLERLKSGGLAAALPRMLDVMLPESLSRHYRFERYAAQSLSTEEALYRVCQEAASNVIRHSGARRISVEAWVDRNAVWLTVIDNGRGLTAQARKGIGLNSMRERMARIGGDVSLRAASPSGLEVRATAPRYDRVLKP